jgi:hypothetical protein
MPECVRDLVNKEESHMKSVGKIVHVNAVLNPLGLLFVAGSLLAGCSKPVPNDGAT